MKENAIALDETLLGIVLPRQPDGIGAPVRSLSQPSRGSVTPVSPAQRVRWFDDLLALYAPRAES